MIWNNDIIMNNDKNYVRNNKYLKKSNIYILMDKIFYNDK